MRRIIYMAFAAGLAYGIWAFTYWQLNPFNWSVFGRFCFLITVLLAVGGAISFAVKETNADALSEWRKEQAKTGK